MASETMVSAAIGGGVGASMQTMSRRRAGQSQVDLPARHARREMSYDFATATVDNTAAGPVSCRRRAHIPTACQLSRGCPSLW
jgi:hypothetical protein